MGMLWYPEGFEIAVDNPGYGQVSIRGDHGEWSQDLAGGDVGAFLAQLTARALGTAPGGEEASLLPAFITTATARELLPAVQQAVILAGAGTDKYERLFPDPDEGPPAPLCAKCWEGSYFSGYPLGSTSCQEYGHHPFGVREGLSWEAARESYNWHRARWERHRRGEAEERQH